MPVPNKLIDDLVPILPGPHIKVLLALWRATVGWSQEGVEMSYGQIAKAAGVGRSVVRESLAWFSKAGLLSVQSGKSTRVRNVIFVKRGLSYQDAARLLSSLVSLKSKRKQMESTNFRIVQQPRTVVSSNDVLGSPATSRFKESIKEKKESCAGFVHGEFVRGVEEPVDKNESPDRLAAATRSQVESEGSGTSVREQRQEQQQPLLLSEHAGMEKRAPIETVTEPSGSVEDLEAGIWRTKVRHAISDAQNAGMSREAQLAEGVKVAVSWMMTQRVHTLKNVREEHVFARAWAKIRKGMEALNSISDWSVFQKHSLAVITRIVAEAGMEEVRAVQA